MSCDVIMVLWQFHRMVDMAAETYQRGLRRGLKQPDAWNNSTCDWAAAANVSRPACILQARACICKNL